MYSRSFLEKMLHIGSVWSAGPWIAPGLTGRQLSKTGIIWRGLRVARSLWFIGVGFGEWQISFLMVWVLVPASSSSLLIRRARDRSEGGIRVQCRG